MTSEYSKFLSMLTLCLALSGLTGCFEVGEPVQVEELAAVPPPSPPPGVTNNAPTISGVPDKAIEVGGLYSFTPSAADRDGDPVTFTVERRPDWLIFDSSDGSLTGVPMLGEIGMYDNIRVAVTDGALSSSLPAFDVEVVQIASSNSAPTISGKPDIEVNAGEIYSFTPLASDPDGDSVTFSIQNRPSWSTFDGSTGTLSGVPATTDAGTFNNVRISVTDGQMNTSLPAFSVQVLRPNNNAPSISGVPSTAISSGDSYSFTPTAADSDADPLAFSIQNNPSWSSFDRSTGSLNGVPTPGDVGTYEAIRISVTDGQLSTSLADFTIEVIQASTTNTAPRISGLPDPTVNVGESYSFTPTADDIDNNLLTFSIQNRPAWSNFDRSTGTLSGVPTITDEGAYENVRIMVTDGQMNTSLSTFSILVVRLNINAPTISGTPSTTVNTGETYTFTPTASDADGDPVTFSIQNGPSWATFNRSTGMLNGIPSTGNLGTHNNILITATDGRSSASLAAFGITVVEASPPNSAPTISGTPAAELIVGGSYAFTPAASDPDGDALLFTIQNPPSWAIFDESTGALSGEPSQGDIGTHANIAITVSDGALSASLANFSIVVNQTATGSATLTWTPPTTNSDGSMLTDLAGYYIYYGFTQGNYPYKIKIENSGLSSFVIENLAPNNYVFVSTSFNSADIESEFSAIATKVIN